MTQPMLPAVRTARTRSDLTPQQLRFLEAVQRLHFGVIRNLAIRAGQPQFDDVTEVLRLQKLGVEAPRYVPEAGNFLLKAKFVQILLAFAQIGDGRITEIEVRDGLPQHFVAKEQLG